MVRRNNIFANLDWISILLWVVMIAFGWMNIYSANMMEADTGIFDLSQRFGKQLLWIGASILLAVLLIVLDAKFYIYFSYFLYAALILILLGVLVFGKEINGAKSWFVIGGFQLQPSEFAKPITALALANLLTSHSYNLRKFWHLVKAGAIIMLPPLLILLQPDLGSVLVYFAYSLVLNPFMANTTEKGITVASPRMKREKPVSNRWLNPNSTPNNPVIHAAFTAPFLNDFASII